MGCTLATGPEKLAIQNNVYLEGIAPQTQNQQEGGQGAQGFKGGQVKDHP